MTVKVQRRLSYDYNDTLSAFKNFDTEGTGYLTLEAITTALRSLPDMDDLTEEDCVALMKHIDHNNDGFIDYREFASNFSNLQLTALADGADGADGAELSGTEMERNIVKRAIRGNVQRFKNIYDNLQKQKSKTNASINMLQRLETAANKLSNRIKNNGDANSPSLTSSSLQQRPHSQHVHVNDLFSFGKFVLTSSIGFFQTSGARLYIENDNVVRTTPGSRPSIAPRGVLLERNSGRWYYEITVITPGNAYVGWGDALYTGDSTRALGIGDDDGHSYGYSGWLCSKKYDNKKQPFGFAWSSGDVIGCLIDMNVGEITYSLNGSSEKPLGVAYTNIFDHKERCVGGMTPIISFDAAFTFRVNLGTLTFRHAPPIGTTNARSVHRWIVKKMGNMYANAAGGQFGKLVSTSGDGVLDKIALNDMRVCAAKDADSSGMGHVFPSCIVAGILVSSGKWYYEIEVLSDGLGQLGWCDLEFSGFNNDGVGVGDDKSSWGFDGSRQCTF